MPRLVRRVSRHSKCRAFGQAVVTLSRQDFYLGPHGRGLPGAPIRLLQHLATRREPSVLPRLDDLACGVLAGQSVFKNPSGVSRMLDLASLRSSPTFPALDRDFAGFPPLYNSLVLAWRCRRKGSQCAIILEQTGVAGNVQAPGVGAGRSLLQW